MKRDALARALAFRPSRFALLIVLGLLLGPFAVAAWLALWRLAMWLAWIDLFSVAP